MSNLREERDLGAASRLGPVPGDPEVHRDGDSSRRVRRRLFSTRPVLRSNNADARVGAGFDADFIVIPVVHTFLVGDGNAIGDINGFDPARTNRFAEGKLVEFIPAIPLSPNSGPPGPPTAGAVGGQRSGTKRARRATSVLNAVVAFR